MTRPRSGGFSRCKGRSSRFKQISWRPGAAQALRIGGDFLTAGSLCSLEPAGDLTASAWRVWRTLGVCGRPWRCLASFLSTLAEADVVRSWAACAHPAGARRWARRLGPFGPGDGRELAVPAVGRRSGGRSGYGLAPAGVDAQLSLNPSPKLGQVPPLRFRLARRVTGSRGGGPGARRVDTACYVASNVMFAASEWRVACSGLVQVFTQLRGSGI